MEAARTSSRATSWPSVAAAVATPGAAVVLDVLAGAGARHVAGLAALAAVVGLLRLHRFGREHRAVTAVAGALVLAQPALHVADGLWARSAATLEEPHLAVHLGLLVLHGALVLAAVLVPAVAELLAVALAAAIGRLVRLATTPGAPAPGRPRPRRGGTPDRAFGSLTGVAYAARRGPPVLRTA